MKSRSHEGRDRIVAPLISVTVMLLLWSLAVRQFAIPEYILPKPEAVLSALATGYIRGAFWPHFAFTIKATLGGFLIGACLALITGAVAAESRLFDRFLGPIIVGFQAVPKVALAPLITVWFGYEMASKIVMVILISFFPLFVNTVAGVRNTNPALIDLMRSYSASRSQIFWRVKLPSAADHIFAGLQIALVLSLLGAVVSEFVASSKGLGYLIKVSSVNLQVDIVFAAALSLALIGLAGHAAINALHHRVVFWGAQRIALPE